ncbi:MAG: hypothetical protein Q7S74_02095 [Nanoarchaeota archaeon]|nr:hypothetical protein [Nanoarchaeota archaeon]
MVNKFGTNDNLNLEAISEVVNSELNERIAQLGSDFRLNNLTPLQLTPDKGYTGKAQAEITYECRPVGNGNLTIVLFRPGDGTGNKSDFQIEGIPAKYTPRLKTDYAEIFMAIGTGYNNKWIPGVTCLNEVVIRKDTPGVYDRPDSCTSTRSRFRNICLSKESKKNKHFSNLKQFSFTLHKGKHYGNPHAITFPESPWLKRLEPYESLFQVGAFLAFPKNTIELEHCYKKTDENKYDFVN